MSGQDNELRLFLELIGACLMKWQSVEDAHYILFLKMLGAPQEEICSVIYMDWTLKSSKQGLAPCTSRHSKADCRKICARLEQ
jgi:hypothetical protein